MSDTEIRMGALLEIAKRAGASSYAGAVGWLVGRGWIEVRGDVTQVAIDPNIELVITRPGERRADRYTGKAA